MVFGDVQAARAEDDGEQRQHQRNHQRGVLHAGAGGVGVGADQQVDAEHDALELQGDIRQHADQADQRHHHCQALRLAVACGDEVGDRGDVLLLADQHHLLQHPGREDHQQHRAQVDGQERPELLGGLADRAEEGPAGAVHRQRQAVHPGTQARRQRCAAAVAVEGDGEHDGHIGQGDHGDQPAGQRHENSGARKITRSRSISLARERRFVSGDVGRSGRSSQAALSCDQRRIDSSAAHGEYSAQNSYRCLYNKTRARPHAPIVR